MSRTVVRRFLCSVVLSSVVLSLGAASCGGGTGRPSEDALPFEANLVYPGAIEIERTFDDGQSGTYLEGGSADVPASLRVRFRVDGASSQQILDWYDDALNDLGWTPYEPMTVPHAAGGFRAGPDGLRVSILVTTGPDPVSEYELGLGLSVAD